MSATIGTRVGHFVWHELVTADVEAAKAFYARLFGWEFEIYKPGEMDYAMISANGQSHGGFMAPDPSRGIPSHWLGHVLVDDADAALARAEKLGGKAAFGPVDIPEIGRFALLADPQGGVVSAYRPAAEDGPVAAGTFLWDEFLAGDVEGAKAYYTEVFGWTTEAMDMGGAGTYTLFKRDGESVAGVMSNPAEHVPPHWLTYIATADTDGTIEAARGLGATVYAPAMDIEGVGRFAVLGDPSGAAFGILQPSAR